MRIFDLFKKPTPPGDPRCYPKAGMAVEDLTSALAVVDSLGPEVDRRILRAEVLGEGRLKVVTGHITGSRNSDRHELVLQRESGNWCIVSHMNFRVS